MAEIEYLQPKKTDGKSKGPMEEVYRSLMDLVHQEDDQGTYYKKSLALMIKPFPSPYACLYIQMASKVIEEYQHKGSTSPEFWAGAVRRFMQESLAQKRPALKMYNTRKDAEAAEAYSLALLAVPVYNRNGFAIGAVAIVVQVANKQQAEQQLAILESLVNFMSFAAGMTDHSQRASCSHQTLENLSRAGKYASSRELSFAITNNLRNRMGLDQVALGLVRHRKIKLISISGLDTIPKGSKEVARIQEAMIECLDMGHDCVYQLGKDQDESSISDYRLHRQWHKLSGNSCVVSIPLRLDDHIMGIMSFKRPPNQPFSQEEVTKIREMTEPYIGGFDLVDRANRPLKEHVQESVKSSLSSLKHLRSWKNKVVLLGMISFLTWFVFGTLPYRVFVPVTIEQSQKRHIAAPVESALLSANCLMGDRVAKGDILCVFDSEKLQLVRQELLAQLTIARLEEMQMEAEMDSMNTRLAQANRQYLESRLKTLNHRIAQTTVTAPFDGLIVRGDLRMSLGRTLPQGTPLYEIAKAANWQVSMHVSERNAADISENCSGVVAVNVRPEKLFDIQIKRMSSEAQMIKMKNVFKAEADLNINNPWMKAGMEGVAKLDVGQRPVWWITLHKVIDYFHLNLWL
ncbi:MAG: efflux RND transporter periplasmic adaptor subunit [Phycisphaerae bacterium]|nr:efflux RND transporter periplasmic adaptor subunit [Phycisphaerae bacterium]